MTLPVRGAVPTARRRSLRPPCRAPVQLTGRAVGVRGYPDGHSGRAVGPRGDAWRVTVAVGGGLGSARLGPRVAARPEDLGHLDRQDVEVARGRRRLGEPDVLVGPCGPGVDRHADLVVADVVDAVEDLDLPLAGALDFLAEVEGRLGGVDADGRLDQGLAIARHVARLGAPDVL